MTVLAIRIIAVDPVRYAVINIDLTRLLNWARVPLSDDVFAHLFHNLGNFNIGSLFAKFDMDRGKNNKFDCHVSRLVEYPC